VSIEINHRWLNDTVLYTAENAQDVRAAVVEAVSRGADLGGADLRRAYLGGANLGGADLRGAYLGGADLGGAYGINPFVTTPLHILADQPGAIRAYKLVTAAGVGPIRGGIHYEIGGTYEVTDANPDASVACAAGINVASLDWCIKEWQEGYRILLVEFTAADIACIPIGSDGKFRLHRCTVVGEKELAAIGLGTKAAVQT